MGWLRRHLSVMIAVQVTAVSADAQEALPQWRLSAPLLTLSGEQFELHRVSGAALLSGGRIVVADAGNDRLLVFSASGRLIRSMGRSGSGPGDVQLIWRLAVLQDTILTYDPGLSRVSLWSAEDGFTRSHSLTDPTHRYELQAFVSPTLFIVTGGARTERTEAGLFTETFDVLTMDVVAGTKLLLGQRPWHYRFLYLQQNGTTTYTTPFLGTAHVAATAGRMLTVPLAAAHVEVGPIAGGAVRSIPLPVRRRAFDRSLIDAYRDSLIASNRRSTVPVPGAEERISNVFGTSFPLPENRPVIERVQAVGNEVWLRLFPEGGERTPWYVFDLQREQLAAQIDLPTGWRVLGGDATRILILQRAEDGVESVVVHAVDRMSR